jgi:chemotaxis protein MotB
MSKKNKQKKHSEEEGGEAWLLPYSDLMTLLLAVFIVLFAVSKVDQQKAEDISNAFKGMLTGSEGVMAEEGNSIIHQYITEDIDEIASEADSTEENENNEDNAVQESNSVSQEDLVKFLGQDELNKLVELQTRLDVIFEKTEMTDNISTSIDLRGLVISLNNAILFDSGSTEIKTEHEDTLIKIAEIIRSVNNYIRVEGHTDNRPISTSIYPSNWELSTARAARVVRLFTEECNIPAEKLVAVGYGEYKPVADNSTEEGREKNRRIDIIILSEKYNNLEDQ